MSVIPVNLTFGFVSRLKPDNYTQHNDTAETVNIQRPASQANTHTHTHCVVLTHRPAYAVSLRNRNQK